MGRASICVCTKLKKGVAADNTGQTRFEIYRLVKKTQFSEVLEIKISHRCDLVSDLRVKNRIQEKAMIVINIHCDDLTREN